MYYICIVLCKYSITENNTNIIKVNLRDFVSEYLERILIRLLHHL